VTVDNEQPPVVVVVVVGAGKNPNKIPENRKSRRARDKQERAAALAAAVCTANVTITSAAAETPRESPCTSHASYEVKLTAPRVSTYEYQLLLQEISLDHEYTRALTTMSGYMDANCQLNDESQRLEAEQACNEAWVAIARYQKFQQRNNDVIEYDLPREYSFGTEATSPDAQMSADRLVKSLSFQTIDIEISALEWEQRQMTASNTKNIPNAYISANRLLIFLSAQTLMESEISALEWEQRQMNEQHKSYAAEAAEKG
jgi:hypothetical protein